MDRRLKLLDLFCGAGGAAMGYTEAGFNVTGVDLVHGNYPFKFIRADAMELIRVKSFVQHFDIIHASPPCKRYSIATPNKFKSGHPDYIPELRELLKATGKPYVIENVPGSTLKNFVALSGGMFGLKLHRVRWFECNPQILFPPFDGAYRGAGMRAAFNFDEGKIITVAGKKFKKKDAEIAMGIDWMTVRELAQAIPPDYTKWIGQQFVNLIQ